MIDAWLGYTKDSKNIEIFKVKLRWSKSSRLLQRVALLVRDWREIRQENMIHTYNVT